MIVRHWWLQTHSTDQSALTSLPLQRPTRHSAIHNHTASVISLQEIAVHLTSPQPISQSAGGCYAFLRLPPEIRTHIYSHLLPTTEPRSISRAIRRTCRQINHKVEHEVRKAFVRKMIHLQQLASGGCQRFATIFYSAERYHVEVVLQLPQVYFSSPANPSSPQARTIVDKVLLSFVELLPLNARSITVTLQPRP